MNGKIFVVSASSGAGKTSVVNQCILSYGKELNIQRVVTYTTKTPRSDEVCGVDYEFVSVVEFQQKIKEGFFLEWSDAYGAFYGSPKDIVQETKGGRSFVIILDRSGACSIKALVEDSVLVWIGVPDIKVLEDRLLGRAANSQEEIESRILIAKLELEQESKNSVFDYVLINEDFNESVLKLRDIISSELGVVK